MKQNIIAYSVKIHNQIYMKLIDSLIYTNVKKLREPILQYDKIIFIENQVYNSIDVTISSRLYTGSRKFMHLKTH